MINTVVVGDVLTPHIVVLPVQNVASGPPTEDGRPVLPLGVLHSRVYIGK